MKYVLPWLWMVRMQISGICVTCLFICISIKFILQMYVYLMIFLAQICYSAVAAKQDYCIELSQKSLSTILGQAFNPRYMSVDPPGVTSGDGSKLGYKRSSYDIPFYADDDIVSLGDFPAWETNHFAYFEQKNRRRDVHARSVFVDRGAYSKADMFKSRPWECSSEIHWIDLGINYFPRYIRSIECIAKKCWYGHFNCKPKSFTIKVLRRKTGSCIRISDKLILITSDEFEKDYTELWIWEEIAVNFCCECVMLY